MYIVYTIPTYTYIQFDVQKYKDGYNSCIVSRGEEYARTICLGFLLFWHGKKKLSQDPYVPV